MHCDFAQSLLWTVTGSRLSSGRRLSDALSAALRSRRSRRKIIQASFGRFAGSRELSAQVYRRGESIENQNEKKTPLSNSEPFDRLLDLNVPAAASPES